jgi:hypothetical protein
MKRLFIPLGLLAALALPATAATAAPTKADKREGTKECRQLLRTVETRANFVQVVKLEAKANSKNAFGRCVKVRAADAASERNTAFKAAKQACDALKRAPGTKGKPANPGAYGRCVSAAARALNVKADAEQREDTLNPARTCRGMQEADATAFKARFPGKNGFGKCVSQQAKAQDEQTQTPA